MIKFEEKNGTGIIYLNRPDKKNALNPQLISELKNIIVRLKNDDNIKSLIISGKGDTFCAGADLNYLQELSSNTSVMNEKDSESIAELFLNIYSFPKPVIAAVNGAAIAGGCGLATVCDIVIADENKGKFGYSEVKIGFIPAVVSIFLIRRIGEMKARRLLISAEIIDANEAYRIGLADKVSSDVMKDALQTAVSINKNSLQSTKLTKDLTQIISNMGIKDAVDYCVRLNALSRSTEEFKNGIEKFLSK